MSQPLDIARGLSIREVCLLEKDRDLLELGGLANEVNISSFGNDCIYHEYVYIAIGSYSRLTTEQWLSKHIEKADSLVKESSSEIKFSYTSFKRVSIEKLLLLTKSLSEKYPHIEISPIDIFQIHNIKIHEGISIKETLQMFYDAGARILDGRHPTYLDIEECLSFHQIAHNIGYRSHLFLVYKPEQDMEEWFTYLEQARLLQNKFEGFLSFTPVPLKHFQSTFNKSNIERDLKIMSLSRIFLHNVAFIQVPISRHGISLSQMALSFGANAIRGRISDTPNSRFVRCSDLKTINRAEISSLITKALRVPKESNAYFEYERDLNFDYKEHRNLTKELSMQLYKLQHRGELSGQEYLDLAENCPLIQLGLSSKIIKKDQLYIKSYESFSSELKEPSSQRAFFGITKLLNGSLEDNIKTKLDKNIELVIPDHKDKFGILTNTEIHEFHKKLSSSGFSSLGKVEITATFNGDGKPFWALFLKKLDFYNNLSEETGSKLAGVTISRARGSYLTPLEFLRGIAIARLKLKPSIAISIPIENIPHLLRLEDKSDRVREQTRLAPLCLEFGANQIIEKVI